MVGIIDNVGNVIHIYRNEHQKELREIKKCLAIGPGGLFHVDPTIEKYNKKYIIEYVRGFTREDNTQMMHPVIHTIDFPIQPNEVHAMRDHMNN
jgi:hypothetical protein